jgi:hypothetical protein
MTEENQNTEEEVREFETVEEAVAEKGKPKTIEDVIDSNTARISIQANSTEDTTEKFIKIGRVAVNGWVSRLSQAARESISENDKEMLAIKLGEVIGDAFNTSITTYTDAVLNMRRQVSKRIHEANDDIQRAKEGAPRGEPN